MKRISSIHRGRLSAQSASAQHARGRGRGRGVDEETETIACQSSINSIDSASVMLLAPLAHFGNGDKASIRIFDRMGFAPS